MTQSVEVTGQQPTAPSNVSVTQMSLGSLQIIDRAGVELVASRAKIVCNLQEIALI